MQLQIKTQLLSSNNILPDITYPVYIHMLQRASCTSMELYQYMYHLRDGNDVSSQLLARGPRKRHVVCR